MAKHDRRGITLAAYISGPHPQRLVEMLERYGSKSAGITRLLRLAELLGGIEELEEFIFQRLNEQR